MLVEFITQLVTRGERVLACAPSNIAVDNLVERLAKIRSPRKLRVVRLGHPARVLPQILGQTLDSHVNRSEETKIIAGLRKDLGQL